MAASFEIIIIPAMLVAASFLCRTAAEGRVDTTLDSYSCYRSYALNGNFPYAHRYAFSWAKVDTSVVPSRSHYDKCTYGDITAYVHGSCSLHISQLECIDCLEAALIKSVSMCRFPLRASFTLSDCVLEYQEFPFKDEL